MGTWGHRSFEGDSALDFVDDLVGGKTWSPASEAFAAVLAVGDGDLDEPEGSMALAAAEAVAIAIGKPGSKVPENLAAWSAKAKAPAAKLIEQAKLAVARVLERSELRELWDEADEPALWDGEVKGLLQRLTMSAKRPEATTG